MTLRRWLAIAIGIVLLMRLWPSIAPFFWPSLKPRAERIKRRLDQAAAAVMVAIAVSTLVQGERAWAAVVAVLAIPSVIAAFRALRA